MNSFCKKCPTQMVYRLTVILLHFNAKDLKIFEIFIFVYFILWILLPRWIEKKSILDMITITVEFFSNFSMNGLKIN